MRTNHQSLRIIRELRGYTQTEFAAAANIDRPNYAHIEAGRRQGTPEQIVAIAEALRVPIGAIAYMTGETAVPVPEAVA